MDNYNQYNQRPMMETPEPKSKLGRYVLIGGLLGACVSLIDSGTRRQMGRTLDNVKDGGSSFMMNVMQDPSHVTDQISNYLQNTASNIRRTAQDVTDDMREMAQKVSGMTQSTKQAYQYAMEAGGEITEIASKLRHTGSDFSLSSANTPAFISDASTPPYNVMSDSTASTTSNSSSGTNNSTNSSSPSSSFGILNQTSNKSSANSNSSINSAVNNLASSVSSSGATNKDEAVLMETAKDAVDELTDK